MTHTNVNSGAQKGIVVNSTVVDIDVKGNKIVTPVGGKDIKSNDIRKDFVEIPVQDGAMLKDDSGKPVAIGSKADIMAKQKQMGSDMEK